MARTKRSLPADLLRWVEARQRYHLSHALVQMAKELGMNPKKFGKLANHRQEPWKLPLAEFIAECYRKRFGREQPEVVRSIEAHWKERERKRVEKKEHKRLLREARPEDQRTATEAEPDVPF